MLIIDWDNLVKTPLKKPAAVTCGVFDGIHRGHRALIEKVTGRHEMQSVVVTFKENPRRVLRPNDFTRDIISLDQKLSLLDGLGVETVVLIDFSLDFSKIDGGDFLMDLIRCAMMQYMAIGGNFKCGRGGALDAKGIKAFCGALNVEADVIPPVTEDGEPVSSSRIRAALARSDTVLVKRLLGYEYGCAGIL
ncbi:MAG: FAD synthetase family protein [Spirochaetaceae bacterium]|jgi:riboflavin kinase/FMN adenylyltransferase|nr:FAD synthetase family protein [Spirochaetaceae bacterium]